MTSKRYRYDPESGEMIDITEGDYRPSKKGALNHMGGLWGDRHYDGLQATDGADISTRKKHREYMRRKGLTTADDFKGDWDRAKQAREHYMQHGGSIRKDDIRAAIERLNNRR